MAFDQSSFDAEPSGAQLKRKNAVTASRGR